MTSTVRKWLRGLIAAVVNGVSNGFLVVMVDPTTFNLQDGKVKLGTVMLLSGALGLFTYLKDHALPDEEPA